MVSWITSVSLAIACLVIALIVIRWLPALVSTMVISAADARSHAGLTQRRRETLRRLTTHLTRFVVVAVCTVAILALFINTAGLLTFLGLFTAALGVSAGRLVNDYVSGFIFIFEDLFNVGEKVEIHDIEGTVVDINLRTTILLAPSGEIFTIPNGEVRVVRNFGRGEFSLASIHVAVRSTHLDEAMALLEQLVPTLSGMIPELIEPPKILSEDGTLSERVNLTIFAKAQFAHGVDARRKLLLIVQDSFAQAKIDINAA